MGTASPRICKWRQTDPLNNDSSQWIGLEQQDSWSMRSLEEGAGSSTQQRRQQGRDLSSLSTALWAWEQHLASVGEGLTVSAQDYWGLFPHPGPWQWEHRWAGNIFLLINSSPTLRASVNPTREGNPTRSSIACNGNSKKTINLLTHKLS